MEHDLRLAASAGFLLLPTPIVEGVRLDGLVLRYDPTLSSEVRARLVARALRERGERLVA